MSEQLKPCPFCASTEVFVSEDERGQWRWVFCNICGADGPCVDYRQTYTDEEAKAFVVSRWNMRLGDPCNTGCKITRAVREMNDSLGTD